ncbi:hypothetical protein [Pseudalkalibacillus salsuginis]|uniref:hypothetical protein n=1 Tax=Pseudalkalibacillus salsuginis TaxID=2910972 RepID=UPI001F3B1A2A|nr:hypothetical protein [Pseudalkalibacillus salsuginis]MCF6411779.1 hypothetical protein [Pseudalkalibacillus salsuginis]
MVAVKKCLAPPYDHLDQFSPPETVDTLAEIEGFTHAEPNFVWFEPPRRTSSDLRGMSGRYHFSLRVDKPWDWAMIRDMSDVPIQVDPTQKERG